MFKTFLFNFLANVKKNLSRSQHVFGPRRNVVAEGGYLKLDVPPMGLKLLHVFGMDVHFHLYSLYQYN